VEAGGISIGTYESYSILNTLIEMGHLQLAHCIPINKVDSKADYTLMTQLGMKRTKGLIQYHWIKYIIAQGQRDLFWAMAIKSMEIT